MTVPASRVTAESQGQGAVGFPIQVDLQTDQPGAFGGLRRILVALGEPAHVVGSRHQPEWNLLFPETWPTAPPLADLANSPSERRLHRDSEQVFRVITMGATAIADGVRNMGTPIALTGAGRADLVSLRCVMRAAERLALETDERLLGVSDLEMTPVWGAGRALALRLEHMPRIRERLEPEAGLAQLQGKASETTPIALDSEELLFGRLRNQELAPPERVAAGVLAIRACFFSTNYEGGLLAAEATLEILDAVDRTLRVDDVRSEFERLDPGLVNPAIEIDARALESVAEIRSLLWRSIGVISAHVGDNLAALDAFNHALECTVEAVSTARLRMYRALVFVKRMHQAEAGRAEIAAVFAVLEGRDDSEGLLELAWLRNVNALSFFQEGVLGRAFEEAKLGLRLVGAQHGPHATHLKINLISNLSVLQEVAGRVDDSLRTWERFLEVSDGWGPAVLRVHRYRDAGLRLKLGDRAGALAHYREAYDATVSLGDLLHQHIVASDLGRAYLDQGETGEAAAWFMRASDSARLIGDPMAVARSSIGAGLAEGTVDVSEVQRLASLSRTFPEEAAQVSAALDGGRRDDLLALLPKPRTKVNIPTLFRLVFV